jgi:hypothetical protein
MKEEKLEQLRKVFETTLTDMVDKVTHCLNMKEYLRIPKSYTEKLLYEVKIRVNNNKGGD